MELLVSYAMSFIGVPYKWGGSNPISGFDCSGFVQEILTAFGIDLPGDQNAQAYYDHFSKDGKIGMMGPGALAFYGKDIKRISHITFMVSPTISVGADGGGSSTIDRQYADKMDAFVKMRPVHYRQDLVAIVMPNYEV